MGSWEIEVGIVCHLANGPEIVYTGQTAIINITVIRPTIFVVVRMAPLVTRLALCARRFVS